MRVRAAAECVERRLMVKRTLSNAHTTHTHTHTQHAKVSPLLEQPVGMAMYEWKDGQLGAVCVQDGALLFALFADDDRDGGGAHCVPPADLCARAAVLCAPCLQLAVLTWGLPL